MNNIDLDFFPGGVKKAVTFSYDDGRIEDICLVKLLNKYNLKGTFHLCCPEWRSRYDFLKECNAQFVEYDEYKELYKGHEISCHLASHPFTYKLPRQAALAEIMKNKALLEDICHYPVRGLSYPFGSFTDETVDVFKTAGMEYGRTAGETGAFALPDDLMRWSATCHHSRANDLVEAFHKKESFPALKLFNIWGHSYEFYKESQWEQMEQLCCDISNRSDTWYATYIEIADYLGAMRALVFSCDLKTVYNPTAITVYIAVNDKPVKVLSGKVTELF